MKDKIISFRTHQIHFGLSTVRYANKVKKMRFEIVQKHYPKSEYNLKQRDIIIYFIYYVLLLRIAKVDRSLKFEIKNYGEPSIKNPKPEN